MATYGDIVSRINNSLNSVSKDNRIPKRFILNVVKDIATFLVAQKLGDRSLYKETNPYTTISCFELEPLDVVKCDIIEFRRCKSVMKSVNKLPRLIDSKYGVSLKEVTSIDDETEFKYTTPAQYRRDKNRGESEYKYYYVKDGYLYLLDTEVPRVNLYVLTLDAENVKSCDECNDCKSLWDYEIAIPDKLLEAAVQEALKTISIRKQIPRDENSNTNDGG
jgi:hypothetical protein